MSVFRTCFVLSLLVLYPASPLFAIQKLVPKTEAQKLLSFAPLVKKTAPAVVNIFTQKTIKARRSVPSLFDDPFFQRFFGDRFNIPFNNLESKQQNSLGSGVIVSPDGIIVSNRHVIEGADEIQVTLVDRREFVAKVLLTDAKTDLAILKINSKGEALPYIDIQDSDELEVGDLVLAIGNPFGVGQTVTSGIVSALARTKIGNSDLNSYIQTDAAINPGNSGGALVSVYGRLVGVNTAIYSKSGGSHGIGFAIPSNMVKAVIRGLSSNGDLVRPWFGATGQSVTQDIANSLGLKIPSGVLINAVNSDSAAYQAGVEIGDLVMAVNGYEVNDAVGLRNRIAMLPVGDTAVIRIWRSGKTRAVKLTLQPPPNIPLMNKSRMQGDQPLSGAIVGNMSPALAEKIRVDPFIKGVFIFKIIDGSPAQRLGFRSKDYLRSVNDKEILNVEDLVQVMSKAADRWYIDILRNGRPRKMVINR